MSNLRESLTYQTATGKPAWIGNTLFILGCATAAAVATVFFTPSADRTFANLPQPQKNIVRPVEPKAKINPPPVAATTANIAISSPPDDMKFSYRGTSKLEAAMDFDFRFIYADGVITNGTAARFANFLNLNSIAPGAVVIFNSPGGLVTEAMDLGKEIRAAGFATSIKEAKLRPDGQTIGPPNGCFSSCTLAFLGGVERTVPSHALFGVHQISTNAALSPTDALKFGQIAMGAIVEYASSMGTKAEFISELTRADPDGINLLSETTLAKLDVTTPEFQTNWEIKSIESRFYLLGTTRTHGGVDKIGLSCTSSGPEMVFLFNTSGKFMQDTLEYTTDYGFEFDDTHVDLLPSEILQTVKKLNDEYVVVAVAPSPRILGRLLIANNLTFEMMVPSHTTYSGWTTDFASGREQFFSFLKSCG